MSADTVDMAAGDVADRVMALVRNMREELVVLQGTRDDARAKASAAGLDEESLWNEWFNENIHDADLYAVSVKDPDAGYLGWLARRIAEPFRLPGLAVGALVERLGADDGMRVALVLWPQEVAWAHRMRRSQDLRIAVLSHLFVANARANPSREVARIAEYYRDAVASPGYAEAIEHTLSPEEIREGYGDEKFRPLFLRYAEGTLGQRVDAMSITELQALATHVAGLEERELRGFAKERVLKSLKGASIVTMTGVIAEAIKRGLDSNDLLWEWDRFVDAIRNDAFQVPPGTGRPYTEFMTWLRTESEPGSGPDSEDCSARMVAVLAGARGWVSALPLEYQSMGAGDPEQFIGWSDAVIAKTRRPPRDLVLDYGFYLVSRALR